MRKLIYLTMFSSCLIAEDALAYCSFIGSPKPVIQVPVPTQIVISAAPIGKTLASYSETLWSTDISCSYKSLISVTLETGLLPSRLPKVYETGVKGVGVKILTELDTSKNTWVLPYSWTTDSNGNNNLPKRVHVEFVRTGRDVASGQAPISFKSVFGDGVVSVAFQSSGTTTIVNDVFFAGCESVGAAVNVKMGTETIDNITKGSVRNVPFNFDVRCSGLKPGKAVPVKVYFEGDSQVDGMLKLSNADQPGVASGVGIALVNDKNVKLPFDIARSINLDSTGSSEAGEMYRFSGSAKYVPSGGQMKPGKGDATMSFVLNYN